MPDYVVRTRYQTSGLRDSAGDANAAFAAFDKLGGLLTAVKAAMLAVGSALVFGKATHEIISLGSAAEDTRIAIAAMMQAGGAAGLSNSTDDFNKALGMSDEIILRMRKHARDLPGEFEDLMQVFRGVMSPSMAGGKSIDQIEAFSARMMAVAATLQVPSAVAGHELGAILGGATRANMPIWARLHPFLDEKDVKNWKNLTEGERFEKILKATQGFQPAIEKFASTWSAISSSTKDYSKEVTRAFGAPIFDGFKSALSAINDWYSLHRTQILGLAELIGTGLVNAVKRVGEAARSVAGSLGGAARQLWGPTGISKERLAVGAAGAAGVAYGAPGLGLAVGSLISFATHTDDVIVTLAALRDIFDSMVGQLQTLTSFYTSVSTDIGNVLAVVLPPLLWGLAHGLHFLFNGFAIFANGIGVLFHGLVQTLMPLLTILGGLFRSTLMAVGTVMGGVLALLGYFIQAVAPLLEFLIGLIATVVGWFAKLATAIADLVTWLFKKIPGLGKEKGDETPDQGPPQPTLLDKIAAALPKMADTDSQFADALKKATPAKGKHETTNHITQHVTQHVSQADAPRRLLIATKRVLQQAVEHPIEGAFSYGTALR